MTNCDIIHKLTSLWYTLLINHHKDRDCHWYISQRYSYISKPVYVVEHHGYIIHNFEDKEFNTFEKAEYYLLSKLFEHIREEIRSGLENVDIDEYSVVDKSFWESKIVELKKIKAEYTNMAKDKYTYDF